LHLALTSLDFRDTLSDDRWCATVGIDKNVGAAILNGNLWTDRAYYICQYNCK